MSAAAKVLLLVLTVCVHANGYGISDSGKGNNSTRKPISQQHNQQNGAVHTTKSALENKTKSTKIPVPKQRSAMSDQLGMEVLELQKMQKSLLTDIANGQTTPRKQRLLREIDQQIQVRISRQNQLLRATGTPQKLLTTKQPIQQKVAKEEDRERQPLQKLQLSQQQPKHLQQQTKQSQQVGTLQNKQQLLHPVKQLQPEHILTPILTPQQTDIMQSPVAMLNQPLQSINNNVQYLGPPLGLQSMQKASQHLQAQQYPPTLQIPPLLPRSFVAPHLIQQQNQSMLSQANLQANVQANMQANMMPMQQMLLPMNSLGLRQALLAQNQRYFVLGSGSDGAGNSVQLSEFANPSVNVSPKKPITTSPAPTTKATPLPATEATTKPTITTTTTTEIPATTTESLDDETNGVPLIQMDHLRQSYYEDSVTKQRLEIQKLRLEIRALRRTEMQNMGGGEENEDGPQRRRNMFGMRRMPFPMFR